MIRLVVPFFFLKSMTTSNKISINHADDMRMSRKYNSKKHTSPFRRVNNVSEWLRGRVQFVNDFVYSISLIRLGLAVKL